LQLNRSGPAGLGLEIGIDHVGACVVDLTGTVRARRVTPSAHRDRPPEVGLAAAAELAEAVIADAGLTICGAGVALPGVIGTDGRLQRAPNLPGWIDLAVHAELSTRLGGAPVRAGNEADLAALAELWFGDGRGPAADGPHASPGPDVDFLYVSGGIGVGAGIVLGGALFRGAGGRAGELGHVVVDPHGPPCSCGGHGCLEQAAGQRALLQAAGAGTVEELLDRPAAAIERAANALGIALTGAVHLLDVRAVVLGGLYAQLGDGLRDAVAAQLAARVGPVQVRRARPASGGSLRAAAAWVVRERLRQP
jgi:predicted NBD/HSP70 family sugar kinase